MPKERLRSILYRIPFTHKLCQLRIRFSDWKAIAYPYFKYKILHPRGVFLVLTPAHGNLGDHAIAMAEKNILLDLNISYCEITGTQLEILRCHGFLNVLNRRIIVINGGGNLGTLWFSAEKLFRKIIQDNPNSRIILMPNTFYYEDTEWGRAELNNSIGIYNTHTDLHLFAREEISYNAMKNIYRNVELVPDMVLTLNYGESPFPRQGCLLCLRSDLEKTMQPEQAQQLEDIVRKHFGDLVEYTDMVVPHKVSIPDRENTVNTKIQQFQKAQVVVTDRLHAMIFCAISQTPCVVVYSKSHKVQGTYEWIRHLPYIRLAEEISDVDALIPELLAIDKCEYNNANLLPYYEKIEQVLLRK